MGDPVDGRADIYALGCMLYRCLTGRTPYEAETAFAMMQGHALAAIPDVMRAARVPVAPGVKVAIERALRKKPEERFQTAREMRTMLELVKSSLVPDDEAPTMAWSAKAEPAPAPAVAPVNPAPPPPPVAAAPQKPKLTVHAAPRKAKPSAPVADSTADYAPLPTNKMPKWLPWAIAAVVVAAIVASVLAWK